MITHDNIGGKLDKPTESFREKLDKIAPAPVGPGDNFRIKPSAIFTRDLSLAVAQLRDAYEQLAIGSVLDQKEFADGVIAPQIERIEATLRRLA